MTSRQLVLLLLTLVGLGILFTIIKIFVFPPAAVVPSVSPTPTLTVSPSPTFTATSTGKMTLAFGERGGTADVGITPLNLIEDSRCGINVVCIQAGTVRIRVALSAQNLNTTTETMELGKSLTVAGKQVTLMNVSPAAYAGQAISTSTYRFTFEVK